MPIRFLNDESGMIISAELILIATIVFCAAAVGWGAVGSAVTTELDDISEMVGVVDQSFNVTGHRAVSDISTEKGHGQCAAFGFNDLDDDCDCLGVNILTTAGKLQEGGTASETGDGGDDAAADG